jgi:hypothetical protein
MKSFSVLIGFEVFAVLVVGLFLLLCILSGCTMREMQISDENQVVIAKITSRHVGDELAKNYPEVAVTIEKICRDIIDQEDSELVNSIIEILSNDQIDDPLLRADIQDIISLLNVEIEKTQIIQAIAEGLLSGITGGRING